MPRDDLIKTSYGTACPRCLLWPDLCTCDPSHAVRQIFFHEPSEERQGLDAWERATGLKSGYR